MTKIIRGAIEKVTQYGEMNELQTQSCFWKYFVELKTYLSLGSIYKTYGTGKELNDENTH